MTISAMSNGAELGLLKGKIAFDNAQEEELIINRLMKEAEFSADEITDIQLLATKLAEGVRDARTTAGGIDLLTQEFSLDSKEGIALMCLAEAMLRIPDTATRNKLIRDKIVDNDWKSHLGKSPSLFVNATAWGLLVTGKLLKKNDHAKLAEALTSVIRKGGEAAVRAGVAYAMKLLGNQFVTGQSIEEAIKVASKREERGYKYSYDMLGEAALTVEDADRYFRDYYHAIEEIGKAGGGQGPIEGPGVSVKISGLHPRYEVMQHERVIEEMYPKLLQLAQLAKQFDIGFHLDQEEVARFDLTLEMLERLANEPSLAGWNGLGISLQAYHKRGRAVVDFIIALARASKRKILVRLVKGAYWDSEIKRCQSEGSVNYPVFTRKVHSDVSYVACARELLKAQDAVFPQFATHNAFSIAAVFRLGAGNQFEFQCLHGMGESVYDQVVGKDKLGKACRIYAPVGPHETLLAYLVRRLLENGANSSFVNQIVDPAVSIAEIVADPVEKAKRTKGYSHPKIVMPPNILPGRKNANPLNFDSPEFSDAFSKLASGKRCFNFCGEGSAASTVAFKAPNSLQNIAYEVDIPSAEISLSQLNQFVSETSVEKLSLTTKSEIIRRLADAIELTPEVLGSILVHDFGRTLADAAIEVREVINVMRLHATQAATDQQLVTQVSKEAVSVVWASLSEAGSLFSDLSRAFLTNAKVALLTTPQLVPLVDYINTALIALSAETKSLVNVVCIPREGLASIVPTLRADRVIVNATDLASLNAINESLKQSQGPSLIQSLMTSANAMIVDSTALPEQVISDVMVSAYDFSGQHANALKLLCIQSETADSIIAMLSSMLNERTIGASNQVSTDIGPVSDPQTVVEYDAYIDHLKKRRFNVYQAKRYDAAKLTGYFCNPAIVDLGSINDLKQANLNLRAPIVHVVRWQSEQLNELLDVLNQSLNVNSICIHTRINETVGQILSRSTAASVFVNRNISRRVSGMQLSGTAGKHSTGPSYNGPFALSSFGQFQHSEWVTDSCFQRPTIMNNDKYYEMPHVDENAKLTPKLTKLLENAESRKARLNDLYQFSLKYIGFNNVYRQYLSQLIARLYHFVDSSTPIALPSLTGEENTLEFMPKGKVLVMSGNEASQMGLILSAFAFGNKVFVKKGSLSEAVAAVLKSSDIVLLDQLNETSVNFAEIDSALMIAGEQTDSGLVSRLRIAGCPVFECSQDTFSVHPFVKERVVSINASASGGNTQLMILSETP
ncbi:proline dehydrogenase family protein [Leeia sp. TBRC 13508]|uniref:Bifunctional protein PutA n=1 Tax=Leeia speluncae TaxID=2884804 RepID=A0ABS8D9T6_9NEIS|nr:proline dehydrogenase family protein [Leeia speluncae]MCB6184973.1 proline dehydrogenase family protein [Leeia speluncae]